MLRVDTKITCVSLRYKDCVLRVGIKIVWVLLILKITVETHGILGSGRLLFGYLAIAVWR